MVRHLTRAVRTLEVLASTCRVRALPAETSSLVASHPAVESRLDGGAAAQRARILEGMTQAVAEKGYVAATVADAVRAAHVSRGTFYSLFATKEECFLEAYRHGVEVIVDRIEAAVAAERGDWRPKLRAALRAYVDTLASEPRFARTYHLEIHAAGPGRRPSATPFCAASPTATGAPSRAPGASGPASASPRARRSSCSPPAPTSSCARACARTG